MIVDIINKSTNPNPEYKTIGAAGFDIMASMDNQQTILPGERLTIPTGLYVKIPDGYELQIRSRSGLAANNGIMVLNSPGTIDCFSEDMLITTINGDKHITDISINDVIISYNIELGVFEKDIIKKIFHTGEQEIIQIVTDYGVLEVTDNTEVLTSNGWVTAKNLNYDDEILIG